MLYPINAKTLDYGAVWHRITLKANMRSEDMQINY